MAALTPHIATAANFVAMVNTALVNDSGRGGGRAPADPQSRLTTMLDRLNTDKLWAAEYGDYVKNDRTRPPSERISFAAALGLLAQLVTQVRR